MLKLACCIIAYGEGEPKCEHVRFDSLNVNRPKVKHTMQKFMACDKVDSIIFINGGSNHDG